MRTTGTSGDSPIPLQAFFRLAILIAAAVAMASCSRHNSAALVKEGVHPGTSESAIGAAKRMYRYNPRGTFGDKVQYESLAPDANGGIYLLQCRKEKCCAIEVLFVNGGVSRDKAVEMVNHLLPAGAGTRMTEHDDWELNDSRIAKPLEFFYYDSGARAELIYADATKSAGKHNLVERLTITQETI